MEDKPRALVQRLLHEYSPTDPDRDFDAIKQNVRPDFSTFDALCRELHASILAESLLLSLDFAAVLADTSASKATEDAVERWIGFVPEARAGFPREEWFNKWAEAGLLCKSSRMLGKLVRLGQASVIANSKGWKPTGECAELWSEMVASKLHAKFADALLMGFLSRKRLADGTDDREMLLSTFLDKVEVKAREDWLASLLLNRRIIAPPQSLILLLRSMGRLGESFVEHVIAVWADEAFVMTSNAQRHAQISAIVRFALLQYGKEIPESLSSLIVEGVSVHLNCNLVDKRNLGMIIGEGFSSLREDDPNSRLDFGLDRTTVHDEYAEFLEANSVGSNTGIKQTEMVKQESSDGASHSKPSALDQIIDVTSPLNWPWPAPAASLFSDDSGDKVDNDDDDACSLEPYDLSDNPTDGLVAIPKQLAQVPAMLSSDQYESVQMALVHLGDLIRINRNRQDTQRRAARLVWTLLELENKFGLADFDANRSRALLSLVVSAPRMSGPAIARAVYSREINVGVKLVALNSLMDGAKLLAEGGFTDEVVEDEDREDSHKPTPTHDDLIGRVTRKSKKLEIKSRPTARRNDFAHVAYESFFAPLCRRLAQFESEPLLLCKIVHALGLFVEKAKHAGGEAMRMADELITLIPWMNTRREAEVRRTALYALASIASVNRDLLSEWQEWLIQVAQEDPDSVARELAKRIVAALMK